VDGTVSGRCAPGVAIDIRLRTDAGLVVRLDFDRHQRRNQVKLSLLDLPFLPDEIRDIAPDRLRPATDPAPSPS
jgi:NAD+ kinase